VTFVVDASLVIGLLANRRSDEVLRKRLSEPRSLHAPHLLDAEVASGIRGLLLGKRLAADRAATMISDFAALRIVRHAMTPLLDRILELRANLSAYDAAYVATAEALDLPLLTRDARVARAVGHQAKVQIYR
jgi:predicted nucleic acid-binding protein